MPMRSAGSPEFGSSLRPRRLRSATRSGESSVRRCFSRFAARRRSRQPPFGSCSSAIARCGLEKRPARSPDAPGAMRSLVPLHVFASGPIIIKIDAHRPYTRQLARALRCSGEVHLLCPPLGAYSLTHDQPPNRRGPTHSPYASRQAFTRSPARRGTAGRLPLTPELTGIRSRRPRLPLRCGRRCGARQSAYGSQGPSSTGSVHFSLSLCR
jgi:hypothetical protein